MSDARTKDLTRWNRAGLSRFAYVDGNAAVWLDELRLTMLARYARGLSGEARTEDYWRELSSRELSPAEADEADANAASLVWKALFEGLPAKPETAKRRNERLLALYAKRSPDQAHEIMRAFARAAHVLLGHVDAYANDGYLRTATQWDSMRKLAAMIGYQPTPGAAASTVVGMIVGPADIGRVEIERGVSTSFTPPGGGQPVVFETVETIDAHPALNTVRAKGFDRNLTIFDPQVLGADKPNRWIAPKGAKPKPGDIAIVRAIDGANAPEATLIKVASLTEDAAFADIQLEALTKDQWAKFATRLLSKPDKVLKPRARSVPGRVVVSVQNMALWTVGTVLFVKDALGTQIPVKVAAAADGRVELEGVSGLSGPIELNFANQYDAHSGSTVTPLGVGNVWFETSSGFVNVDTPEEVKSGDAKVFRRFSRPSSSSSVGYTMGAAVARMTVDVVGEAPSILATLDAEKSIEFVGKPSPNLVAGSWFVARKLSDNSLKPLKVEGVRVEAESHFVAFDQKLDQSATAYEFHGPMTEEYRPEDYDRGQNPVFNGGVVLVGLDATSQKLLKVGRKIIVEDERKGHAVPVLLTIASVLDGAHLNTGVATEAKVTFVESPSILDGFISGWTVLRLNTARATHGETRGAKALGSGNGELFRQSFNLSVKNVTFTPSSAAESGVAPDIDVAVQDVLWSYRDLSDPTAEGGDFWSVGLNEDDTIDVFFRRRLPTGNNNAAVTRHRVGGGPSGNAVPPYGFTKPAKKHRYVTDIVQPFAASGGSEREPVSSMRQSAPSRLSANGRAVSLLDFEKLAARHASVWQAKAMQLPEVGAAIRLIVVAAFGGAVDQAFKDVLSDFILQRAIPGVRLTIEGFRSVPVRITARIRVDAAKYDKDDVAEAALAALAETFSLRRRKLGQQFLVGEVLAALEKVEGVTTAVADVRLSTLFALRSRFRFIEQRFGALETKELFLLNLPKSIISMPSGAEMTRPPLQYPDGSLRAIFPDVDQVAYVPDTGFLTVLAEVA